MSVSYICQKTAAILDEQLMGRYGYTLQQLVEQAGLASALAACRVFPLPAHALVISGPGNNGADGLVCARMLKLFGYECTVVYPKRSSNPFMEQLVQQCTSFSIPVLSSLPPLSSSHSFIVDALFGFSFKPPIRPPFNEILSQVVKSAIPIFSIDIPSGWDVENGPSSDPSYSITPTALISLSCPKKGVSSFNGNHFLGGRFLPPSLMEELSITLPPYPSTDLILPL